MLQTHSVFEIKVAIKLYINFFFFEEWAQYFLFRSQTQHAAAAASVPLQDNTSVDQDEPYLWLLSFSAAQWAQEDECNLCSCARSLSLSVWCVIGLCAAPQMFFLPEHSNSDERLMEMVGRRSGSSGQRELRNHEFSSLGDNEDRLMSV